MKKRNDITAKEKIFNSFCDLVFTTSFDKITVTDVVKKAEINRSTFYDNYQTIDELIKKYVEVETTKLLGNPDYFSNKSAKEIIYNVLGIIKANARIYSIINKTSYNYVPFEYIKNSVTSNLTLNDFLFCKSGFDKVIENWIDTNCKQDIDELTDYFVSILHKLFEFKQ